MRVAGCFTAISHGTSAAGLGSSFWRAKARSQPLAEIMIPPAVHGRAITTTNVPIPRTTQDCEGGVLMPEGLWFRVYRLLVMALGGVLVLIDILNLNLFLSSLHILIVLHRFSIRTIGGVRVGIMHSSGKRKRGRGRIRSD